MIKKLLVEEKGLKHLNSNTYCIGNGKIAGYFLNGDILQLFGPCYSIPSAVSMICSDDCYEMLPKRVKQSDVYQTEVFLDKIKIAEIEDFVHEENPVFIRKVKSKREITYKLDSEFIIERKDNLFANGVKSFIIRIDEGKIVFAKCKTEYEIFCSLIFSNNVRIVDNSIVFPEGESYVIFVSGDGEKSKTKSFINCMHLSKETLSWSLDEIKNNRILSWKKFFAESAIYEDILALGDDKEQRIIEEVLIALKTQTSYDGGVLAGMYYHLAYGRDMYGAIRGYLNLGFIKQARKCIEFFVQNYRKKGEMPNANGMGIFCSHRHECDEVEQTGYYLTEIIDYYNKTKDVTIVLSNLDYIEYLLLSQEKNLCCNMLPFNGDETYIAGGLLPRACIDHGSMEATALYINCAKKIITILKETGGFSKDWLEDRIETLAQVTNDFCNNFIEEGKIYTNNPCRIEKLVLPDYRHGVCQHCNKIDWVKKTKDNGYVCLSCYETYNSSASHEKFSLDCAIYMPLYLNFELIPETIVINNLNRSVSKLNSKNQEKSNSVGYELGLFLYLVSKRNMYDEANFIYQKLIEQVENGGVWVEYYVNGKPSQESCPYRPWESAINLTGIVEFLKIKKERSKL